MDRRTLLVLILSSIYIERRATGKIEQLEYYDEVLEKTKPKSNEYQSLELGKDPAEELKALIDRVKDFTIELEDREGFLQRVRMACSHDSYLFESVELFIRPDYTDEEIKRKVNQTRYTISEYMADLQFKELSKSMYRIGNGDNYTRSEKLDQIDELITRLNELQVRYGASTGDRRHPAMIDGVRLSDGEEALNIMKKAVDSIAPDAVFRPGWQCVARQFGANGGGLPGESLLIGAMEYNYKSSMCLQHFRWAAIYNKPKLINPTKKPLLYRMSLENDLNQDILFLYQEIYANEFGYLPNMEEIEIDEADAFVKDRLRRNGWHVIMEQYDPSKLTYRDVIKILEDLDSQGYEVKMFNVDYIAMIDRSGLHNGVSGDDIREVFRRVANYCKAKKIWYVTPHQIGSRAFELLRQGREEDFVKDIAGKGYWDGCQRLGQEPDMDQITHVVHTANGSWLTSASSRHRGAKPTPQEDKTWIRKFENGYIADDINGTDLTRTKIGGGTVSGDKSDVEDYASF
jgi:hypothetical protein